MTGLCLWLFLYLFIFTTGTSSQCCSRLWSITSLVITLMNSGQSDCCFASNKCGVLVSPFLAINASGCILFSVSSPKDFTFATKDVNWPCLASCGMQLYTVQIPIVNADSASALSIPTVKMRFILGAIPLRAWPDCLISEVLMSIGWKMRPSVDEPSPCSKAVCN